jgi:hypothetical protein
MINPMQITLDVEWAPDFIIDFVADILVESQVKATWFVTHNSKAIDRLKENSNLFELGIHPNFLPNSTQGQTHRDVLEYCLKIVPDAISMRAHALVQSSPLFNQIVRDTDIKVDLSLFLPNGENIKPFEMLPIEYQKHHRKLIRIPYYWQDCYNMRYSETSWLLEDFLNKDGLKIFNFHPIHIYLNSSSNKSYDSLKKKFGTISKADIESIKPFLNSGNGTGTFFKQLIANISSSHNSSCIRDIYSTFIS